MRSPRSAVIDFLILITAAAACAPAPPSGPSTPSTKKNNSPFGNDEPDNQAAPNTDGPSTFPPSTGPSSSTSTGQLGCHGYGACYGAYNSQTQTDAQYAACSAACDAHATQAAISQLNSAYSCGVSACMQAGQCTSQQDTSDGCTYCAYDAVSAIFGLPCGGDPICNVQQCAQIVSSCMAATP